MEPYGRRLKEPARSLRMNMTDAEQVLWQRIRRKQIRNVRFYRQKPLLSFIVDFYCHAAKLVIEIDGKQHYTDQGIVYDTERTQVLQGYGLKVLRYTNQQLVDNFQEVCWDIEKNLQQ